MEPNNVSTLVSTAATSSERDLVEDAARGDSRAFEELVRRNWYPVHRMLVAVLGSAADAEDVTQEAFLRAWLSLSAFRGDSLFSTWVYRIALNSAKTQLARRSRRRELPLGDVLLFRASDARDDPRKQVELNGVITSLTDYLADLPAPYRTAVILRDLRGLTNVEAAELLGNRRAQLQEPSPPGTFRSSASHRRDQCQGIGYERTLAWGGRAGEAAGVEP